MTDFSFHENLPRTLQQGTVGWGEHSETHQNIACKTHGGFRFTLPTLRIRLFALMMVVFGATSPASAQAPYLLAASDIEKPAAAASTSLHGIAPKDLDAYPDIRSRIEQGNLAGALTLLQNRQASHNNDPAYFNLLGILALKVAEYTTAVSAFERVVLMEPDNAGAWLDLAIASAENGNASSADAYFDYVESQFAPPPAVRKIISRYRTRMTARQDFSPWQVNLDAMFGVDSNANSGLQSSAVPLTFGTERIDLVLDPSFRARSDKYIQAGVGTRYRHVLGDNLLEFSAGLRTRDYQHEHNFSTISANLSTGLHRATGIGDASTWLHFEHLWLGGTPLLRNVRAIAQLERPYDSCRLGVSAEGEWRRYVNLGTLDANLVWGQAGVACDWKLAQIPVQTVLIGRLGFDDPTGMRAGGETRHKEIIAQFGMPIAWGARADLSLTWAEAIDKEGYSPLLEQNAARHLDRRNLRMLVTMPLTVASDFQILAEDNRFKSNLALFQQSGRSLSMGFRYRF
jgi:hypothetical protein